MQRVMVVHQRQNLLFFAPEDIIQVCTLCPVVAVVRCFARAGDLGQKVQ
jgi:hypothetical protein